MGCARTIGRKGVVSTVNPRERISSSTGVPSGHETIASGPAAISSAENSSAPLNSAG
jgi:hypothetical protein